MSGLNSELKEAAAVAAESAANVATRGRNIEEVSNQARTLSEESKKFQTTAKETQALFQPSNPLHSLIVLLLGCIWLWWRS
mmetsp:Transcript_26768/g.61684  ORF Transcript_26768/g.61684 Transcript_26768/m.61684 type:complete len:81 (-) Transcript_26768:1456-1698(-)